MGPSPAAAEESPAGPGQGCGAGCCPGAAGVCCPGAVRPSYGDAEGTPAPWEAVGPGSWAGAAAGRDRSPSDARAPGAGTERARPRATASWMSPASRRASGTSWSVNSSARPPAYPWPTARTFQAPWRRYSSRATTADSASRPVSVKLATSSPSRPVTTTKGAATAPKRAGPCPADGRASSTLTRCTASGTASRSTASRWSAAACRETSSPGTVGVPGWATRSAPWTLPFSSPSVAPPRPVCRPRPGSPGGPGKRVVLPRVSSAVIAFPPVSLVRPCHSCVARTAAPAASARTVRDRHRTACSRGRSARASATGPAGWPASGPGRCGRWPGTDGGHGPALPRPVHLRHDLGGEGAPPASV